ncbi:MAG: DsbC family protein [Betaproteobacteria bacterium]
MHKTISTFVFLALACAAFGAGASEATVKAALTKKYPEIPVDSVTKTPVPGIYEAFANGQMIYTDENATYLFVNANLIDTAKKTNLTEERMSKLTAIRFDQLPLNLAVKRVKGKGTRKLAYFADPNCGYCKKFEQDLTNINDVTIYVFLYPVLGPDSLEKAKSIWCSKDKIKAWDDQLVRGIAPTAAASCDTSSIDKTLAFGKQKNITGTPTMFFVDGQRVPGAIPGEMIEQRLAAAK